MSFPSIGDESSGNTPPPTPDAGMSPLLNFHRRDPAEIAEKVALAEYGPAQIELVQDFYRQLFEFVGDELWPDEPVGPLGDHWRGVGGEQSTRYLISIANVIWDLMRNACPGLGRTLTQRLKTVLRPADGHAYQEALVELEVGGVIALRLSPVLLEPLVPADWRPSHGKQPMSPDYGLRGPEGLVTVEVTVWHWEAYAAWSRMNNAIYTALSARMRKRGVARNVRIELPLKSPQEVVEDLWSHDFCDRVCDEEYGAIVTTDDAAPRPVRMQWRPMLHFPDADNIDWNVVAANGGPPFTAGPGAGYAFGYAINPCITDDDRNDAFNSLRRSIDRKKRQRDPAVPHLLAIGPAISRIPVSADEYGDIWDVLGPLIDERLWPNPKYRWLSGILEHHANRIAPPSQFSYFEGYTPNPNATLPVPETIDRAMRGEAEFHYMWQRPRRTSL